MAMDLTSNTALLRAVTSGGLPTVVQNFPNPLQTHGMFGSELSDNLLCGEFRVPLPDLTDTDSCHGVAIHRPAVRLLRPAAGGRRFPTAPHDGPRPQPLIPANLRAQLRIAPPCASRSPVAARSGLFDPVRYAVLELRVAKD